MSLFIRNLIFTILQPGLVAALIPYMILGEEISTRISQQFFNLGIHSFGIIIFLLGLIIMLWCIASFAIHGRGTLSPIDPTKKLVIIGLYKYSRNPMYVGVILILLGETIYFNSLDLFVYTIFVFVGFHLFAIFIEEPRLRKDFGEEYLKYCERVRRWI